MTNFDFLLTDKRFMSFAEPAIKAEMLLHIDKSSCAINCRKAMEFAIKWMYSVDKALKMPHQDTLVNLMNNKDFKEIVGSDIWKRTDLIRRVGNNAVHDEKPISMEQAEICLENLHIFLDFVAYCYGKDYTSAAFDKALLELTPEEALSFVSGEAVDVAGILEENKALREELTARRIEQMPGYIPKPLDLAGYATRKVYIDTMLEDAGWVEGKNLLINQPLDGMSADYALLGEKGEILALVEARLSCTDWEQGRIQAEKWADFCEKSQKLRPVLFLTNGFDTHMIEKGLPRRHTAAIYSARDLEKLFALRKERRPLKDAPVDKSIVSRCYQEEAIRAVCAGFDEGRRSALLIMASGSGKTRTVIALCKVLLEQHRAQNILFLSDRDSLVTQARRGFSELLPELPCAELSPEDEVCEARGVFATYETMLTAIDNIRCGDGRLFTCGTFDLVICDEAHPSLCEKFRDIFSYFDAPLIGLTSTPRDETDPAVYELFEPVTGEATYCYELAQAVRDGFLVDFTVVKTSLQFAHSGAAYDELSASDRRAYEETFDEEDDRKNAALDEWIFRDENIRQALQILMRKGIRIDQGKKLGKTIIFAKNHAHAQKIFRVFKNDYPALRGFAKVIDSRTKDAQSAIDRFSDPKKLPQIAISVDTLDTGINVPEVLNLVFFRRVMSKAKFHQMIGRGTRLCQGLMDGENKQSFNVFDFCGNFAFFRMDKRGEPLSLPAAGRVFAQKIRLAAALDEKDPDLRTALLAELAAQVKALNRESFAVRQHLEAAERYADEKNWTLPAEEAARELAPLMTDSSDALCREEELLTEELAAAGSEPYDRQKLLALEKLRAAL